MAYRVDLTVRAERDLDNIYARVSAENSAAGAVWYFELEDAVRGLKILPHRCPIIAESKETKGGLRHLLYGSKRGVYRVIYEINESDKLVSVITIRHSAMDRFMGEGER
jgi:toxin ParE1/3/4